jgi:hypothetical protein
MTVFLFFLLPFFGGVEERSLHFTYRQYKNKPSCRVITRRVSLNSHIAKYTDNIQRSLHVGNRQTLRGLVHSFIFLSSIYWQFFVYHHQKIFANSIRINVSRIDPTPPFFHPCFLSLSLSLSLNIIPPLLTAKIRSKNTNASFSRPSRSHYRQKIGWMNRVY